MAFDPWDWSYHQDESSYSMLTGWRCDFYADYVYDVIEEDALNEKSCIQVLRMLITRADSEIDELEQNLVLLQSELACAEHEEWSELCCNVLREKINCLEISLGSLRNTDEGDIEVQLLMHIEPAERVHEIVRALLRNYFPENDEQALHAIITLDSRSNVTEHAAYLLDENEMFSIIDSNINVKEETKESSITEKCTGSNLSLKIQEKKTNDPDLIERENTKVKDSNVNSLRLTAGHHNGKKMLEKNDVRSSQKGEAKEHSSTPNKTASQDLSLKPERKRKYNPEMIKPADTKMKNSCKDALPLVIGQSNKKILGDSDLKTTSEEIEEHNSTPVVGDFILGSSSKLEGKRTDNGKVKPAKTIRRGSSSDAIRNTAGCSPGKFELKVGGNLEVREDNSNAMHKSKILNLSSNPESKGGNLPKTAKPANNISKSSSAEALRPATGLNGRKKGFGSESGAFIQEESAKSDLELKLSEFAVKIARKEFINGLKNAPNEGIESPDSSSRTECERKTPQKVTVQEDGFIKTGDPSTSLLDLKDQRGQDTTKLQLMERNSLDVPKSKAAGHGKKPILNLSLKPPKLKEKRKIGSDTPQVQEPAFPSVGVFSNSSIARSKSKQKTGVSTNDHFLNVEVTKRLGRRGQYEAKKNSDAPVDCKSSVLVSQRKGKGTSKFPITVKIQNSTHVNMDLLNLPYRATDSGIKENLQIMKSYSSDDSHNKALVPLPSKVVNLNDLTLIDLRAIAKENKLTKYHKLRKQVLLELLEDRLGCC